MLYLYNYIQIYVTIINKKDSNKEKYAINLRARFVGGVGGGADGRK